MCFYIAHGNYVVVILLVVVFVWGASALLLYPRGRGYKENLRVDYKCSSSWTTSLVFSKYKI
jgi:hypothetical protein